MILPLVRRRLGLLACQGQISSSRSKGLVIQRLQSTSTISFRETHLTGLHYDTEALTHLRQLYEQSQHLLQTSIPAHSFYRQSMQETLRERLALLTKYELDSPDLARRTIEAALGEGILEEMVEQAQAELDLIRRMASDWPVWEPLEYPQEECRNHQPPDHDQGSK